MPLSAHQGEKPEDTQANQCILAKLHAFHDWNLCICVCVCVSLVTQSCLTLRPYGLQPPRLLCPWDFSGKNTGMGCHFFLQGIFPTQGLNTRLLQFHIGRQILYHLATREAHEPPKRQPPDAKSKPFFSMVLTSPLPRRLCPPCMHLLMKC